MSNCSTRARFILAIGSDASSAVGSGRLGMSSLQFVVHLSAGQQFTPTRACLGSMGVATIQTVVNNGVVSGLQALVTFVMGVSTALQKV